MIKIAIDAGHGPETPGKCCPDGSMREFSFNSAVAKYVRDGLSDYKDVAVLFTHAADHDVPLEDRTDMANAWGADVLVSIHANAVGSDWNDVQGIETFVFDTRPADALRLANAVQAKLVTATLRVNRGVKAGDLHMLRESHMTAILCECGFMTHRGEAWHLKTDEYRRKCAGAIVSGLVEVYGLNKEAEAVNSQEVVKVIVNGKSIGTGYVDAGVTYVPVRAVAEALGAVVDYDGRSKTVTIKRKSADGK